MFPLKLDAHDESRNSVTSVAVRSTLNPVESGIKEARPASTELNQKLDCPNDTCAYSSLNRLLSIAGVRRCCLTHEQPQGN